MNPYPIMPTRSSLDIRILHRRGSMLCYESIHVRLAGFRSHPGIGPEAEINGPPVVWDASRLQKLRHDLVEVQKALAEWRMRGGLVLTIFGLVTGVIRINEVD